MHTLAQVTYVTVSVPNFNGTRVSTGRKYTRASFGLISVFWTNLLCLIKGFPERKKTIYRQRTTDEWNLMHRVSASVTTQHVEASN